MTDQVVEQDRRVTIPQVATGLAWSDLKEALRRGMTDFRATPTHLLFLGLFYPLAMVIGVWAALNRDLLPLIFPIFSGAALLGPGAAIILYEISRRRERGEPIAWWNALTVLRSPQIVSIILLGLALVAVFLVWLWAASAIYAWAFAGAPPPEGIGGFLRQVTTGGPAMKLILVGNAVGFVFATVVFSLSVVSFPMLLDRAVSPVTAAVTSLRLVLSNPGAMALWATTIVGLLLATVATLFVGLAVALPVLGHASWHLYRRAVT